MDLGIDEILDAKFLEMDKELDEIWKNHICNKDEFDFDEIEDKKEQIRAAIKGL